VRFIKGLVVREVVGSPTFNLSLIFRLLCILVWTHTSGSGTVTLEELLDSIPLLSEANKEKIRTAFEKADDDGKYRL
jgi:hypothetical protein